MEQSGSGKNMKKKIVGIFIVLMLLLLTAISMDAGDIKVTDNNPPRIDSCVYNITEIVIVCKDDDWDCVRCGVDWDLDEYIDEWTEFCECGIEICIGCEDKMGSVEVIAEDIYGARSEPFWLYTNNNMQKNKLINTPFLTFLENHPHLFPLIRQILGL